MALCGSEGSTDQAEGRVPIALVIESVKSQVRSKPGDLRQAARGTGRIYNVASIFGGLYYIIERRGAGVAQNDTDTNPTIRYERGNLAANSVRPFWRAKLTG